MSATSDLAPLVWDRFPALLGETPTSAGATSSLLPDFRLLPPLRSTRSATAATVTGRSYAVADNDDGVEEVRFDFGDAVCRFHMRDARGAHEVRVGLDDWRESWTSVSGASLRHWYEPDRMRVVAGGEWREQNTFEMTWQFVQTPFRDTVVVRFAGDQLTLYRKCERELPLDDEANPHWGGALSYAWRQASLVRRRRNYDVANRVARDLLLMRPRLRAGAGSSHNAMETPSIITLRLPAV